jgi:hypothetical protein
VITGGKSMKIDLEKLYRSTVNDFKGVATESFVKQEFLFKLTELGEEFLAKRK